MSTDNDVFELVDQYTVLGQEMNNVYFYQRGASLSFSAQDFAEDWVEEVLPTVLACQPSDVVHTRVATRNLFDVSDTGEVLHTVSGTLTGAGELLPPMLGAGFTLARTNSTTRSGKKRVYVGGEGVQDSGNWQGAILTPLANLAAEIASIITVTLVQRWFPVIVKRILVSVGEYRLPTNATEATVNPVIGGLVSSIVTTQNSRKIGVGS